MAISNTPLYIGGDNPSLVASTVSVPQEIVKYLALESNGNVDFEQQEMSAYDLAIRMRMYCKLCQESFAVSTSVLLHGASSEYVIDYFTNNESLNQFLRSHRHEAAPVFLRTLVHEAAPVKKVKESVLSIDGKRKIRR